MTKYKVRLDCEVAGIWRTTKDEFELSDAASRHLLPPYGNVIAPITDPAPASAPPARKVSAKAAEADA